ncbi:MAG: hypothetical protein K2X48_12260 [Chitinophagaceae bacterium]|nr:hypothetical protein [Chitinophagaceae bacterium]
MKKLFCFLFFVSCFCMAKAQSEFTAPAVRVEYDSAIIRCNLQLVPVKCIEPMLPADTVINQKKYITLRYGLMNKTVSIKERGNFMVENINVLMIENRSGKDLFIKSGEIVMGGRQDRVFARDTVLPSSSKQHTVPVYCVEENRWSTHEKKFIHRGSVANGLQKIIDSANSQTKVWDEIRKLLKQNNQTGSSSYASLLNQKKFADTASNCMYQLYNLLRSKDSSYVGFIAVTGNHILGADVFISPSLFYQTLPQLLEKYVTEAALSGSAPVLAKEHLKAYADALLQPSTQAEFLNKKGKRFFYKGVLIQITGY